MLPLGQEGILSCSEKSISILVTRNAVQMGIFPIPESIPFVPILIPISSHSPVSCPLELVSTCCSFIIQETGCFSSQSFLQEGIHVSKAFSEGLKSESRALSPMAALPSPGATGAGVGDRNPELLFCANNGNRLFLSLYREKSTAATINVTTWRAATKQKCHPLVKFCRHLVWGSNSASKTHTNTHREEKDDAAVFLQLDFIFILHPYTWKPI